MFNRLLCYALLPTLFSTACGRTDLSPLDYREVDIKNLGEPQPDPDMAVTMFPINDGLEVEAGEPFAVTLELRWNPASKDVSVEYTEVLLGTLFNDSISNIVAVSFDGRNLGDVERVDDGSNNLVISWSETLNEDDDDVLVEDGPHLLTFVVDTNPWIRPGVTREVRLVEFDALRADGSPAIVEFSNTTRSYTIMSNQ